MLQDCFNVYTNDETDYFVCAYCSISVLGTVFNPRVRGSEVKLAG